MSIIRIKKRENPYTQIDKRCLEDSRLSWRARGILAYLLSKPDDWRVSVKDIEARGTEGRDAVQNALKELEKAGYAKFGAVRNKDGKVSGTAWTITEEPTNGFSVHRQDATDNLKNRKSEKPIIGKSAPTNNDIKSNNEKEEEVEATSAGANSVSLKAEKENPIPPVAPAPLPASGRVDIAAEVERLKADQMARENFTLTRKIPADRFERYVADFSREVSSTSETYWKIADFRRHFFNWCEKHYRIEQDKTTTTTPKPVLPRDMVNLNAL